jgi:hypothetical protein
MMIAEQAERRAATRRRGATRPQDPTDAEKSFDEERRMKCIGIDVHPGTLHCTHST